MFVCVRKHVFSLLNNYIFVKSTIVISSSIISKQHTPFTQTRSLTTNNLTMHKYPFTYSLDKLLPTEHTEDSQPVD